MMVPTDKVELVQLLRDLATAIESGETEYQGCQLMSAMNRIILPGGGYGDATDLVFDLRVSVSNERTRELFRKFSAVEHYAPRIPR